VNIESHLTPEEVELLSRLRARIILGQAFLKVAGGDINKARELECKVLGIIAEDLEDLPDLQVDEQPPGTDNPITDSQDKSAG
jgi:hypothetical protein